jgi:undecaprenyl diphosphate synthase
VSVLSSIDKNNLPVHIAIIMDGNGRWAKAQGQERIFGHQRGIQSVREVIEGANEAGIKYLTLYTFSVENWRRSKEEVDALLYLIVYSLNAELEHLQKNSVRLMTIGNLQAMPLICREEFNIACEETQNNTGLTLIIALNYSSRWEIVEAAKQIALEALTGKLSLEEMSENSFSSYLTTSKIPNPDILIRTGKEFRLSNFLLWQISYSELFFSSVLWPDFTKNNLWQIILKYQSRERRFGKTSEQLLT